jgi:hypothetical protein
MPSGGFSSMEQPLVKHLWRDGAVSDKNPERFREVEPLRLGGRTLAEIRSCYDMRDTLDVRPRYHSIAEARALRDWLNEVLP